MAGFDYSSIASDVSALEDKYGLPRGLYANVLEKGERSGPTSVSPKGAIGLAQLMPGTARDMGVANIWDMHQNLEGGAKYLKSMYDKFGGDPRMGAAAYNAGPGAVEKAGGVPDYPETKAYLERVFGMSEAPATNTGLAKPDAVDQQLLDAAKAKMAHADEVSGQAEAQIAESGKRMKEIMDEPLPERPLPPTLKDIPQPKITVKNENGKAVTMIDGQPTDPTRVLGQFLPTIAILGSLRTRNGAMNAMKSASAALNAARQNDKDAIEEAHKSFKEQMDEINAQNNQERQRYLDILEDRRMSMAEKISELQAESSISGNAQMRAMIANGQLDSLYKHLQMRDSALYRVNQIMDMGERRKIDQERVQVEKDRLAETQKYHEAQVTLETAKANRLSLSQWVAQQLADKQNNPKTWNKDRESLLERAEKDLQRLNYAPGEGDSGAGGGARPLPQSQADLQDQQVYMTSRGPATWDASSKSFKPVQAASPEPMAADPGEE